MNKPIVIHHAENHRDYCIRVLTNIDDRERHFKNVNYTISITGLLAVALLNIYGYISIGTVIFNLAMAFVAAYASRQFRVNILTTTAAVAASSLLVSIGVATGILSTGVATILIGLIVVVFLVVMDTLYYVLINDPRKYFNHLLVE